MRIIIYINTHKSRGKMLENKNFKMITNQKGMTLIEIMIVLVIIATMGTVLVTQVNKQLEKGRMNQAKILIAEVGKNLDQYNLDCGAYPTTDQGINALLTPPGSGCANWGPEPYLKKMPKDPWNSELSYSSDGSKYILKSYGKDKKEGGDGYNRDISSEDL
ncbi:MAG: type II secretion system major pseudopilin GspG [Oligoflexia bacterium]|nr:type II secretion system major pseudopilin GspG [Oligoflexia bacterium]